MKKKLFMYMNQIKLANIKHVYINWKNKIVSM